MFRRMEAEAERRVGALTLREATPPEGDAPYRRRPDGPLEIERTRETAAGARPGVVTLLIAILGFLLLLFAAYVRSGPAIGSVSFALVALAWLVLRSSRTEKRVERVHVDGERLRLEGVEEPMSAPIDAVEEIGLGVGTAALRTLWVRVADRGRVMLLEDLTAPEADAAADALREALGHSAAAVPAPFRVEGDDDTAPAAAAPAARELDDDERARLAALRRDMGSSRR